VIESEPPGRLGALGCGPDDLRAANPRLIVASITPFGQRGPRRDWRASDLVAQALGGMLYVNGRRGRPPLGALGSAGLSPGGDHGGDRHSRARSSRATSPAAARTWT
jgi:crotonobetainyl-CoA:carnitine CoA-transferase CaiB-like acyl-CoA transferase